MSQGALTIADDDGAAVLAALNAALARLATRASGTARPADIAIYEVWVETDNPGAGISSVWMWDGTSDVLLGTINTTTHVFTPYGAGLLAATQAEQEAGSSTTVGTTPGRQHHHPSALKFWCALKQTGTQTVLASYNVTSITDGGVGYTTVTIATDFSSANWAPMHSGPSQGAGSPTSLGALLTAAPAAGTVQLTVYNSAFATVDTEFIGVGGAGDHA